MSAISGFSASADLSVRGSNAMPHIGQVPGSSLDYLGVHRENLGVPAGATSQAALTSD